MLTFLIILYPGTTKHKSASAWSLSLELAQFLGSRDLNMDKPAWPINRPKGEERVWYDTKLVLQDEARELLEKYSHIQSEKIEEHVLAMVRPAMANWGSQAC